MTHLVIDLQTMNPILRDKVGLENFLTQAVQLANVELLAGPYLWNTGADDPNPGITGLVVVTTSHFALHTFTRQEMACIDLFSCRHFVVEDMLTLTRRAFKPYCLEHSEVPRMDVRLRRRPLRQEVDHGPKVDKQSH